MVICMKTTLNLDDELVRKAKRSAAERGLTFTRFVEDALREALVVPRREEHRLDWTTERGRRRPPVDPADRDALYELMERRD